MLVMAQHGFLGSSMISPVDVSYLADTVLMLRYFEAQGATVARFRCEETQLPARTHDSRTRHQQRWPARRRATQRVPGRGEPVFQFTKDTVTGQVSKRSSKIELQRRRDQRILAPTGRDGS